MKAPNTKAVSPVLGEVTRSLRLSALLDSEGRRRERAFMREARLLGTDYRSVVKGIRRFALGCAGIVLLFGCARRSEREEKVLHRETPKEAPSAALSSTPPVPVVPRIRALPELDGCLYGDIDERGLGGFCFSGLDDPAKTKNLVWVRRLEGKSLEREEVPFTADRVIAKDPLGRRALILSGEFPNRSAEIWGERSSPASPRAFLMSGALGRSRALVFVARPDNFNGLTLEKAKQAYLFEDGEWSLRDLPKPAESGWARCSWDSLARPNSDDLHLLQICRAPGREFAFALFLLAEGSREFERIPLDNGIFPTKDMARGELSVEPDGVVNLGATNLGRRGSMTLARWSPTGRTWTVLHREMPTRLFSTSAAWGSEVLFTSGEVVAISRDGGKSFRQQELPKGHTLSLSTCSAAGCLVRLDDTIRYSLYRYGDEYPAPR